ncbi:MAG: DNA-binding response regulator [Bacteroidetes bacterium]|nr:MAG: DNA-binding response regulator [Bacteroidota bacterium]
MRKVVKIVLADDHNIVRNGIRSLLENEHGIKVVGESEDGEAAYKLVMQLKPDILISDINMPKVNGIELTEKIIASDVSTHILILSMYNDEAYILKSIEAGVMGYLPKDAEYGEIIKAIRALSKGEMYYNADVTRIITNSLVRSNLIKRELDKLGDLTKREKEVLKNIVAGHSNKIIAEKLFISTRTVDTHRTNIMKKLRAKNTADLVRKAIQNDLI